MYEIHVLSETDSASVFRQEKEGCDVLGILVMIRFFSFVQM
jgi:hypothetical protein